MPCMGVSRETRRRLSHARRFPLPSGVIMSLVRHQGATSQVASSAPPRGFCPVAVAALAHALHFSNSSPSEFTLLCGYSEASL